MRNEFAELLEAARAVIYFDGPTPAALDRLKTAVDDCDNSERFEPDDEDEEEEEY